MMLALLLALHALHVACVENLYPHAFVECADNTLRVKKIDTIPCDAKIDCEWPSDSDEGFYFRLGKRACVAGTCVFETMLDDARPAHRVIAQLESFPEFIAISVPETCFANFCSVLNGKSLAWAARLADNVDLYVRKICSERALHQLLSQRTSMKL